MLNGMYFHSLGSIVQLRFTWYVSIQTNNNKLIFVINQLIKINRGL